MSGSLRPGRFVASLGATPRLSAQHPGVPAALRRRGRVSRLSLRLALAGRVLMSALRLSARRGAAPAAAVGVPGVRASDVADGGDGDARHPHAAAGVVLGGLPGGHPPPGDLGGAAQAPAGHRPLRHGVADPSQAAPGNGRPRTPRAHRPRRSRRLLRRRHRGRPSWRAKVRFEQGDRCRRGRAARRGLGAPAPERDPRPLRRLAVRLRHRGRGARRGGAYRWLAGLPASPSPGL